jgi:hypothetical protein
MQIALAYPEPFLSRRADHPFRPCFSPVRSERNQTESTLGIDGFCRGQVSGSTTLSTPFELLPFEIIDSPNVVA